MSTPAGDGDSGHLAATADPPVRPAATVMVLRDSPAGLEVFVLRRVSGMAFAPGMTVFPGGAVDPVDHQPVGWTGPDPRWWAGRLGTAPDLARALVVAAVRELFEETGVLLAGRAGDAADDPVAVTAGVGPVDAARRAILARQSTLGRLLDAGGLRVRADLLRPWANWITPPGRTRRYDTFFFAAALPAGQRADLLTTEADLGQWQTPRSLLAQGRDGTLRLMPPTVAMLTDLAGFQVVSQVMAVERDVLPVRVRG